MNDGKDSPELTLDRIVTYEIVLAGRPDFGWRDWVAPDTTISFDNRGNGETTITGLFDQAALHGALRRFYAIGLPIVSVKVVGGSKQEGGSGEPGGES